VISLTRKASRAHYQLTHLRVVRKVCDDSIFLYKNKKNLSVLFIFALAKRQGCHQIDVISSESYFKNDVSIGYKS
jgi:hypothetical protein